MAETFGNRNDSQKSKKILPHVRSAVTANGQPPAKNEEKYAASRPV